VLEYIEERDERLDVEFIEDITKKKRFWSEIMRDENADMKDRLKASDYIAKTKGAFFEKAVLKVIVDF
jgi:phage terminase small subunit